MAAVVDPIALPTKCDTIVIELHQAASPYGLVATRTGLINTNGTITVSFPAAQVGNSYYLVLKGRNIIETWSKSPVLFISGNMTFDFTPGTGTLLRMMGSGVYSPHNQGVEGLPMLEKPEHPE